MANLQIKDLPEQVHEELRRRARLDGVTVRAYLINLIQEDQSRPARSEWFARLRHRRPVDPGEPVADLVRADRADRADRAGRAGDVTTSG